MEVEDVELRWRRPVKAKNEREEGERTSKGDTYMYMFAVEERDRRERQGLGAYRRDEKDVN